MVSKIKRVITINRLAMCCFFLLSTGCVQLPVIISEPETHNTAVEQLLKEARYSSNQGQFSTSRASLERALRIEPNNAYVWFELAKVSQREEKNQQALGFAQRALSYSSSTALTETIERFIEAL